MVGHSGILVHRIERAAARAGGGALAAAFLAGLSAVGCGAPERPAEPGAPAGRVVLDLAAELAAATVEQESARLDLGEPSARPHLISGWSVDERDADGTYVWGIGSTAALSFFAAAPAPVDLGLRCKPLAFDGAPEQTVAVAVNGTPLDVLTLEPAQAEVRLEVPAERIASGWNRLDLRFGYHRRPRDVIADSADERPLAARCYAVELGGLGAAALPRVQGGDANTAPDRLELPAGTAVTYYFDQAVDGELTVDAIEAWGPRSGDVKLRLRVRSAGGAEAPPRVVEPGERGPRRLPLPTAGPEVDRIELAAVTEPRGRASGWLGRLLGRPSEAASGVTLVRPAVRQPAAGPADPSGARPEGPAVDPLGSPASMPAGARPSVIIYLIDTLRADHVGAYGYPRPITPSIDRFAADGVLFLNAQAQSSWTRPAVASLLTGLAPQAHGVNRRRDALAGSVDTLAEVLAREGYDTAGVVTNGNAGPNFALDQGFASFRYLRESGRRVERHRLSDQLNRWLFRWLEQRGPESAPYFLYAHATDPHVPYTPAEPFRRRFAPDVDPEIGRLENVRAIIQGRRQPTDTTRRHLIDLYDAEIAFNDHHFGRLIERLKELGQYESTLIVLVSDHGEEFLDHGGWEHGVTLYEEQLRVPLIIKLPGGADAGRRVETVARQVDVMPTVLDLLGIAPPAGLDGASLLRPAERASFAHLALQNRRMNSVNRRGWKLILDDSPFPRGRPIQLYRLADDPRETIELAGERPFERELLSQLMRSFELRLARGVRAAGEEVEIPEELRRQLEALGYL